MKKNTGHNSIGLDFFKSDFFLLKISYPDWMIVSQFYTVFYF